MAMSPNVANQLMINSPKSATQLAMPSAIATTIPGFRLGELAEDMAAMLLRRQAKSRKTRERTEGTVHR